MGSVARTAATSGGLALVVAAFLPWHTAGVTALDAPLALLWDDGARFGQPTVATVLIALAALPAVTGLVVSRSWPPLLAASATSALGLGWLASAPDAGLHAGVTTALGAAGVLFVSAALASGPGRPARGARVRDHGYRYTDHTADVAFRAWGPTRASCFEQAVLGLVASFTDLGGGRASMRAAADGAGTEEWPLDLAAAADEDVLVDLLTEVIYLVDTRDVVPVAVELDDRPSGALTGRFRLAPVDAARVTGAVPKAITYHGLEVVADDDGWRCHVTVDV